MGEEHSIRNRVSRTEADPWNAILGRRPGSYKIPEVGHSLMNTIDRALFERRLERANVTGVIFEKWAENIPHFSCKAPAVMSTIYSIGGTRSVAGEKIRQAERKVGECTDCRAYYLKRNAIYLIYDEKPVESLHAYSQAITLFRELGNDREQAECLIGRGAVKYLMKDYESALHDQEDGMLFLDDDAMHYMVYGVINSASILTKMGRREEARKKVEKAQDLLSGVKDAERPKLILRWIKSLLLEDTGKKKDRKLASQMIYRVEVRMRALDMARERRVLLADQARIARAPHAIRKIAQKALNIEDDPRVRTFIQAVIDDPSRDNILKWRVAVDSYVPPFVEVA